METISASLLDRAIEASECEIRVTTTYSGRGMYGAECPGLTADAESSVTDVLMEMMTLDTDTARSLKNYSRDSMGLGVIIYWPGTTLEGVSRYDEDARADLAKSEFLLLLSEAVRQCEDAGVYDDDIIAHVRMVLNMTEG